MSEAEKERAHVTIDKMNKVGLFVSLQGNIGSGKTTLLEAFQRHIVEKDLDATQCCKACGKLEACRNVNSQAFLVIEEPVAEWSEKRYTTLNNRGEGEDPTLYSLLGLFYKDMKGNGFDFQVGAFTTRVEKMVQRLSEMRVSGASILSERSLRTDRLFFRNLYESGKIPNYQWQIYERFYNVICEHLLQKEDVMIYLTTPPEKCYERHLKRGRDDEVKNEIPIEYLMALDVAHQEMVAQFEKERGSEHVIRVPFDQDMTLQEIDAIAAYIISRLRALQ
jgi:deoxyadenosine/deoxycytidine kinase